MRTIREKGSLLPLPGAVLLLMAWCLLNACDVKPKETLYDYSCREVTETSGAESWIFEGKHQPPLLLDGGSGFVDSVNRALEAAFLPKVAKAVPEKSAITGSRGDRTKYEWTDYPKGVLTIHRSSASDAQFHGYDSIWKITVETPKAPEEKRVRAHSGRKKRGKGR